MSAAQADRSPWWSSPPGRSLRAHVYGAAWVPPRADLLAHPGSPTEIPERTGWILLPIHARRARSTSSLVPESARPWTPRVDSTRGIVSIRLLVRGDAHHRRRGRDPRRSGGRGDRAPRAEQGQLGG